MMSMQNYYGQEFWRFVIMQEAVEVLAKTAVDYPPMQKGASFNLDDTKKHLKEVSNKRGQ